MSNVRQHKRCITAVTDFTLMHISKPLLLSLAALSSCTQEAATNQAAEPDPVLLGARAMQALVCVQVARSPATWRSDLRLSGPGSNELWQTLSEQPLVDHGRSISSVYRRGTDQLYLVVQGGFPETLEVYGPLPAAPQCQGASSLGYTFEVLPNPSVKARPNGIGPRGSVAYPAPRGPIPSVPPYLKR